MGPSVPLNGAVSRQVRMVRAVRKVAAAVVVVVVDVSPIMLANCAPSRRLVGSLAFWNVSSADISLRLHTAVV